MICTNGRQASHLRTRRSGPGVSLSGAGGLRDPGCGGGGENRPAGRRRGTGTSESAPLLTFAEGGVMLFLFCRGSWPEWGTLYVYAVVDPFLDRGQKGVAYGRTVLDPFLVPGRGLKVPPITPP